MFQPTDTSRLLHQDLSGSSHRDDADEVEQRRLRQIFESIDSFLSLRYCIIYQILPLELNNNCLKLGMVEPNHQKALDYIQNLVATKNYSFTTEKINRTYLLKTIAAYTNYIREPKSLEIEDPPTPNEPTLAKSSEQLQTSNETTLAKSIEQLQNKLLKHNPLQNRPTLIINAPEQLGWKKSKLSNPQSKDDSLEENTDSPKSNNSLEDIPSLEVQAIYRSSPVEFLTTLSPQLLWRELLGRTLGVRVGKLCFIRKQDCGRILLSHDGVKQLTIEKVDLQLFQGLLTEFKYLAKIPATSVDKDRQDRQDRRGELLRNHKQERTLLCWQINFGQYGEQATLHVLQGRALQFYQQKQMDEIGVQAWQLAKTLEGKLQHIQTLKAMNPTSCKKISDIRQIQRNLDKYLRNLE